MSKNILKERSERTIALRKEACTLDTSTTEGRSRLDAISNEVADNDAVIHAEARRLELAGQKQVKLSATEERDIQNFDLGKVVRHLHAHARGSMTANDKLDGVEGELINEGITEARAAGVQHGGIMLPRILVRRTPGQVERRDMTAVTAGEGGNTVATIKSGLLDDFFNALVIRNAGATVYEGLVGNLDLPRILAGTAPAGKAENGNADETSPTTAMLSLTPKRLPTYVDLSERLLMQSSQNIEQAVRSTLNAQMSAIMEAAFFHGTGTNEASGIAGTAGIGSVAGGTNGLAPAWIHMVGLETAVDTNNALLGNLAYISNGQTRGKLKQTQKVSGTDSRMILDNDGLLNGYNPYFTNAVSRTLVKGASGSVCSAIFFGDWSDYAVGFWGGMSLEVIRDKPNAIAGLYTLVAATYYDGGVRRPKSFAAMLDALGA